MNSNRYPLPAQTGLVVAPGLPPKNSTLRPDQLNKRLSSAWHHLYDLCPELLKIDPPDGLTILRGFLQWAAEQKAAWNWAMHLRLYCWLLQSPFGAKVTDEHLEVLIDASAARWTVDDTSANRGILLASQGGAHITQDWKAPQAGAGTRVPLERLDLPAPNWTFAYCAVPDPRLREFPGWKPLPARGSLVG
ncbi:putative natural product biosynthesis protein [Pseudomonas aeruginosa]|uniref:putative natural product biosynthesis protein n=1 Tax=Pseudomonas aeruginosa TaxID=287 RepID=UPI002A69E9C3|nr:putative natural product biosynthesis protein [Pseudomonas aeruginosa]MDY1357822.1 putative natural product biosynthesis protein [Pseudomonas aeruginosa]